MQLEFPFFPMVLAFLLLIFILLKLEKNSKANNRTSNLPPGPWKLPVIGNLHQLAGSLPHHRLTDFAKKYGPLMHLQLGEVSTVVVSSPEFAKRVMKTDGVTFASRPPLLGSKIMTYDFSAIIFSPYGESWRQLRKICITELLTTKRVRSFQPIREEEVSNLINWIYLNGGSEINLTKEVYSLMYGITSRAAFGIRSREQEAFVSVIAKTIKVISGFNIADLFPSIGLLQWITGFRFHVERLHQEADRIVENIINDHKKSKSKSEEDHDLIDVLLKIQEHGNLELPLRADNIKAVICEIFGGGSDTVASIVDWAMSEMMKNPRVMKKAQAEVREVFKREEKMDEAGNTEMKYLKLVVKETLRLHPSTPLIPRECGEECEINGFNIPVGTKVIVNAWATGRDPQHWTEPESFIPERFLDHSIDYKGNHFEYIPFGAGKRICPGMLFGLANIEHLLAMLLYHFDWKLPIGMKHEDLDMTESFGVTIRRKKDLCMIPIPFHHSSDA